MAKVDFLRTRKFLATLSDNELIDLWNHTSEDAEYNSVIITYLIDLELDERAERTNLEIRKALQMLEKDEE